MRAGFALHLTTVRWPGTFLEDPRYLDVPGEVVDFIAGQVGMADASRLKRYTERESRGSTGCTSGRSGVPAATASSPQPRRSSPGGWLPGPGRPGTASPKAVFAGGLAWLRERKVLLPRVTTLARLVASGRDESTRQMWEELARLP